MGRRVIKTRHGFRLDVDLGEWIGQHIYLTGDYERPTTELIQSLVREGDTVVDVGANIGFFTLLASRAVGSTGRVIAFEPVASTCAALTANLRLNGTTNVTIHELALSNVAGTVMIHEGPPRNKGLSSIRPIEEASAQRCVPVSPFDAIDIGQGNIRLIKIDVEGAEQLVLEGMQNTLRAQRPDMVVEITDTFLRNFGHSAHSICRLLEPLGYQCREITDRGLVALPSDPSRWPRQFNALFSVS